MYVFSSFVKKEALRYIHLSLSLDPGVYVCVLCVCWCRRRNDGHSIRGDSSVPSAHHNILLHPAPFLIHTLSLFVLGFHVQLTSSCSSDGEEECHHIALHARLPSSSSQFSTHLLKTTRNAFRLSRALFQMPHDSSVTRISRMPPEG